MQNGNIFLKHKILLTLFIVAFCSFLFCYTKYSLGLYFDIPAMLLGNISQDDTFSKFLIFPEERIRYFTNFLVAIPFNTMMVFVKNSSAINILRAFSLSYFILHILGLTANYLIAKRTQRYDIAAICFAFYTFFSLQNAIWACREVHISVFFYFALLSYFLSKTKLGLKDIFPIILISIYLFESFEISSIFGLILFVFAIFFTKKSREELNRWYKVLIGFSGFLVFLYIPIKTIFMSLTEQIDLNQGTNEWFSASKHTIETLFSTNSIICVWAIFLFIFLLVYKKPFSKKIITAIVLSSFAPIFILWKTSHFIPQPMSELQNYSFVFWFIFPVILTILFIDYNKKQISQDFSSNLVSIACIIGIFGSLWQINGCFEFKKYTSYLKDLLSKTQGTFISIPKEDFENKSFLNYNTCFGTMHKAIFLSDDYVIKKLIIPTSDYPDFNEYCMGIESKEHNFYDSERQFLHIQTSMLRLKNKYWDITPIKEEFERINN